MVLYLHLGNKEYSISVHAYEKAVIRFHFQIFSEKGDT